MRGLLCWLIGHSYLCLHINMFEIDDKKKGTISTWKCQYCNKIKKLKYDER